MRQTQRKAEARAKKNPLRPRPRRGGGERRGGDDMWYAGAIGKYKLGRTIGEGAFGKVKMAKNTVSGEMVAIKIIDKVTVMENNLIYQVQREIKTMRLLNHPNIIRIHEVLGTRSKIYIVMEYVSGGQLSDKLSYSKRLTEGEARQLFQQLVDAVGYCHCRGVYHRDLKPQNLLLDSYGNLKISDFGLSTQRKQEAMLSTACGSPCYVAPELLRKKGYEGAAADVWSCGVILFELLAGYLPFDDHNLINLYKKILRANYACPEWFTAVRKKLFARIFDTNPHTVSWVSAQESVSDKIVPSSPIPSFINAFQLIAMSQDLDLSGLFEDKDEDKNRLMLGSKHPIGETIERIEAAARDASFGVERINKSKIKLYPVARANCSGSCINVLAEVIEVAPTDCVVEISKFSREPRVFDEFCKSLFNLLEQPRQHLKRQSSRDDSIIGRTFKKTTSSGDIENSSTLRGSSSS
ncbi:CBL-interacting serine/threonine-protein kinase 21-like protein [Drosera capensis]